MSTRVRVLSAGALWLCVACGGSGIDAEPLFAEATLAELEPVVECRHSHEHELHHVEILADPEAAERYRECVLEGNDCAGGFAPGSLFVKREYEFSGCVPDDLVGYAATLKLEDGSSRAGYDWHWQALAPDFEVREDGAPRVCVTCHEDHCAPPHGFDLRCLPD